MRRSERGRADRKRGQLAGDIDEGEKKLGRKGRVG